MTWKTFFSPAEKIAGSKALLWGAAGLPASIAAAALSGYHPNGLLQFGPGPQGAFVIAALEYLIIWLVPAALFYGLGAWLSTSRVRPVDVLGTTAFAMLPLTAMNLTQLMPGSQKALGAIGRIDPTTGTLDPTAVFAAMSPLFIVLLFVTVILVALMVVWLFNAVRVSCNLRGGRLWGVYLAGLVGGDIVCRLLIGLIR